MRSFLVGFIETALRWAVIVYRLIDLALIGILFLLGIPSYFKIEILTLYVHHCDRYATNGFFEVSEKGM